MLRMTGATDGGPSHPTEWLYQEEGQVFGPITTEALIERLYEGSLTPDTAVALEAGEFTRIRDIEAFRPHLSRAAERQAAQAQQRAEAIAARKRQLVRVTMWIAAGLVLVGIGSAAVVRTVRWRREAQQTAAHAAKSAALQTELDRLMASVTIEPPLEALAGDVPRRRGGRSSRSARGRRTSNLTDASGELTRQEVMRGVRRAFRGFKRCIVEQIQRANGSVGSQIVLTFTIGNDGRASGVTFQDRFLRRSPMLHCFRKKCADFVGGRSKAKFATSSTQYRSEDEHDGGSGS